MFSTLHQPSEVRRLLTQISAEYEAGRRGLEDLASGVSQHQFITARMERMEEIHTELRAIVGDQAIALIAEHLAGEDVPTPGPSTSETREQENAGLL